MQGLPLDFGPSPEARKDSIPFKTTAPAASVVSPASRFRPPLPGFYALLSAW